MAWQREVTYLATGRTQNYYTHADDCYVLADGSFEQVHTEIVWCNGCGKVTGSEWIETLEELDADIADASDPGTPAGQLYLQLYRNRKEREKAIRGYQTALSERRRWLTARISPARCLTCGTTDLIFLRDPEGTDTPAGKVILRDTSTHASMSYHPRYFSPEGERIEYTPPVNEPIVRERK